jgi:imidazoleglycerol phosphate dehydratase HisB
VRALGDEEAVARYRPRWVPLDEQLAPHGVALGEVDVAQRRPPAASFVGSRPGDPWPG